jgi:hypothetical protein
MVCSIVVLHVISFDGLLDPRQLLRSRGSEPLELSLPTLSTLHRTRTARMCSLCTSVVYFLTHQNL